MKLIAAWVAQAALALSLLSAAPALAQDDSTALAVQDASSCNSVWTGLLRKAVHRTIKTALGLRYNIRVNGLDAFKNQDHRGVLILANHPGLIDPVIVMSALEPIFHPRPAMNADVAAEPGVKNVAEFINAITVPSVNGKDLAAAKAAVAAINLISDALAAGDNILLYPAGQIYHSQYEDLAGKSGVETILKKLPNVRVVLVRTQGLWGSSFGYAQTGERPEMKAVGTAAFRHVMANGVFFTPRRQVTMEVVEPQDFPRTARRQDLNRYLEEFFNEGAQPNTFVPYRWWQGSTPVVLPDPVVNVKRFP